jgi:hypothetical protein
MQGNYQPFAARWKRSRPLLKRCGRSGWRFSLLRSRRSCARCSIESSPGTAIRRRAPGESRTGIWSFTRTRRGRRAPVNSAHHVTSYPSLLHAAFPLALSPRMSGEQDDLAERAGFHHGMMCGGGLGQRDLPVHDRPKSRSVSLSPILRII